MNFHYFCYRNLITMNYIIHVGNKKLLEETKNFLNGADYQPSETLGTNEFLMVIPERKVYETISWLNVIEFRELTNDYKLVTLGDIRQLNYEYDGTSKSS